MKTPSIDTAQRAGERRSKVALSLLLVLAILMITQGVGGIQALSQAGYDEARGFALVQKAGSSAQGIAQQDAAAFAALPQELQAPAQAALDDALGLVWQRVRYAGETTQDFSRMEEARRQSALQSLLKETQDEGLRQSTSNALDALKKAHLGMASDGTPAYEKLLSTVAALLPKERGDELLKEVETLKTQDASALQADIAHRAQKLFEEAVAERRLSRFVDGGAGLIPLSKALFTEINAAAPEADVSEAFDLLKQVPRQPEAYEALFDQPAMEAIPQVLNLLDLKELAGARLVAFNKELYAVLKENHPQIDSLDHLPLIALQAEAMQAEFGEALSHQADLLAATAWNERLKPLLNQALVEAVPVAPQSEQAMLASLLSVVEGKDISKLEDGLADKLVAQRDAETAQNIDQYISSLPLDSAVNTKLLLLRGLFTFDAPRLPAATQKALEALDKSGRENLRQDLLKALVNGDAPLPVIAADALSEDGPSQREQLLYLFLLSGNNSGHLFSEQIDTGLRLAIRQNGPRVRAAQTIAQGGGSPVKQFINSQGKVLTLLGALLLIDILLLFFLMYSGRDWRFDFKWLMILLIVDFMLVFQILPLGYLLFKAIMPEGSLSFVTFGRLFSYNMNRSALVNTIVGGLAAMVLGTLLAFPLAWMVGRTNMYGKKFFRSLFVVTYMVPPYVGAMAWLRLLNPNVGTINVMLRGLLGINAAAGPINVYSLGGLVWVLTTFYYPYAFITISRAMEKMDPSLEEASRISGASPFVTLMRVTLPIMTPSLIAGALLVFVSAASCYGIPSIIGAPGRVHTVTTRIIEYYGRGTQGLNDATGLAVFLMALAILILYLSDFVVAKKQYITVSGKSTRPNIVDLRAWRLPLTILVALFAVLVVLVPFTTILTTSLKIDVGKPLMAEGNFTFSQWTTIFSRSETMDSLKNSLIYASVAATVGILVAITMSYLMQRTRIKGRKLPDFLITLGSGSPSVVIALGLIMTMQGRFGVNIYNTAYIIIVAYLIKYMMMGMRTVTSAISQIHISLEESSQVSGASWLMTMRKVTGPLIFPSIAAGWFLIFIPCFYELSMTTLLYSNTTKTIGFQLYEYWTYTSQPQASAMAFGILLIVIFINQFFNRLTKGEFTI